MVAMMLCLALFSCFLMTYFCLLGSDPSYVAFHDEEWGVPAHDDKYVISILLHLVTD